MLGIEVRRADSTQNWYLLAMAQSISRGPLTSQPKKRRRVPKKKIRVTLIPKSIIWVVTQSDMGMQQEVSKETWIIFKNKMISNFPTLSWWNTISVLVFLYSRNETCFQYGVYPSCIQKQYEHALFRQQKSGMLATHRLIKKWIICYAWWWDGTDNKMLQSTRGVKRRERDTQAKHVW